MATTIGFAYLPVFPRTGKWEAQNWVIPVLVSDLACLLSVLSHSKTINLCHKFSTLELFIKKYPDIFYILKKWHTVLLLEQSPLSDIIFSCPNWSVVYLKYSYHNGVLMIEYAGTWMQ